MTIQIVQGKLDTDPFLELDDSARYTKCTMTEEEANMSSGMSINLGRIRSASEQIDNGEYRPNTYTKPISLFESRKKWKSDHRPSSQSSATPPRPMTLTRHPNIADEIDTPPNVRVSTGPGDPIRPNIDTNMSSNMRVLGSVDELYAAISADESNNTNVHDGANASNNADMSPNVKVSSSVDDTHATVDVDVLRRTHILGVGMMLYTTEHDRLMSDDLDSCDEFDKMYKLVNDARYLFDKYLLLEKHLTNLEDDIQDEYLLHCVPNELIHLVASKGATASGDTKKTISSLDNRTRLLIWLTVTPTEVWRECLSVEFVVERLSM